MKNKSLNILILSWEIYPMIAGGLGFLIKHVVTELKNQGHTVTVAVPNLPNMFKPTNTVNLQSLVKKYMSDDIQIKGLDFKLDFFRNPGEKVKKRGWPELYSNYHNKEKKPNLYPNNTPAVTKAFAFAVEEFIKTKKFDVILGADWETIPTFVQLKEKYKTPFVFYINATEFDRNTSKFNGPAKIIANIEAKFYKMADGIISISDISKQMLIKYCNIPEEKIKVVFDDLEFTPIDTDIPDLQKGKNVLFIGRIEGQKGISYLLDTAQKVIQIDPSVKFIIAGDGSKTNQTIQAVAEKELEKNILFTGWLNSEEKKKLYASCDLFVMPSPSEPFGLTALEAIRSKVPVIATNTSGFIGVIPSTPTFNYYDTHAFSQLILHYTSNKKNADRLLKIQTEELAQHSWAKQINSLVEFLNTIIQN